MKRTIKLLLVICCVAMAVMLSSCEWTWKGTEQAPTKATVKHSWIEADCENPRTCAKCGTTEGEALGHRPEKDDGNCVTDVLCKICDKVLTPGFAHTPFEDDGDCTTEVLCSVCNNVAIGAKENHVGGSATCVSGEICETCGTEYGKVAPDNHSFDAELGECTECSLKIAIDATEMTPEELNAAVMYRLGLGIKDIHVTLVSTPEVEMFTAIRRALLDVKGLANGSITLTLAGVTVIPDHSTSTSDGSAIFGRVSGDVDYTGDTILGRTVTAEENLLDLGAVNLPDVISIGQYAFYHCDYLTTLYAPKVQTIGMDAFAYTGLTSVELPEATTIGAFGFSACVDLTSVNLPKATSISGGAFLGCTKLTSVVLTAEGTVTLGTSVFGASDQCLAEGIDLVLSAYNQSDAVKNTWNGYAFKSIQFTCSDGTLNHSLEYTDNGDGTHDYGCDECGYAEVDNENHNFDAISYDCICGAIIEVVDVNLADLTATYVINDSKWYHFTGSGNYGIKVESGNPRIVLDNANITVGEGSAIDIASGSDATIFVLGDNSLSTTAQYSSTTAGGIFVAESGTVNITSNSTNNTLRVTGNTAAAIGGKYIYGGESYNAGNINISNVTVYAYTNNFYAAAIGAAGVGTCGTINITNAVVYAYGAGDKWTSAPSIGNALSLVALPETIPVVMISGSEIHTFRYNSASDYIGYMGDVDGNVDGSTFATGSINCGEGGSVRSSTIYCYTGLDATTTDKVVIYDADGNPTENQN